MSNFTARLLREYAESLTPMMRTDKALLRGAANELVRLDASLTLIAKMPREEDEWDAVDKYKRARAIAQQTLRDTKL